MNLTLQYFDNILSFDEIIEILLGLIFLPHPVYKELEQCLSSNGSGIKKLVSVTTDGTPAMLGKNIGLIGLLKADEDFPDCHSYIICVVRGDEVALHLPPNNGIPVTTVQTSHSNGVSIKSVQ